MQSTAAAEHRSAPERRAAQFDGGTSAVDATRDGHASCTYRGKEKKMVTAHQLARAYDQAVSARWRGEVAAADGFLRWLAVYWDETVVAPAADPVEVSPLGAAGRGICWYETAPAIVGRVPGLAGGYRVPRESDLPRAIPPALVRLFGQPDQPAAARDAAPDAEHPDDGGGAWLGWGGSADRLPADG
jgi:hypothetical protein